jgi:protocatechuate 4,5-dioxygenase beta chain
MWPKIYAAIPSYMKDSQPHTAREETPEVIQGYVKRIQKAFSVLREQIERYEPEALVVIGDDQGDMFDESIIPTLYVFIGSELWGLDGTRYRPHHERNRIIFPCHSELAKFVLKGLIKRGFDAAFGSTFRPLGHPDEGVSHMISHPIPVLTPRLDVPIVPIFLNEYFPPLVSGERCIALGRALADILNEWPGRVAIYASGGLSHDPIGPRAGWIDEPLDRWFLERLERNAVQEFSHLFTFDSDTLRSGTGEMRAWIAVAAAMNRPAKVVDYVRAHHAKTGLAWAYWPPV